jgi:hypothetical protein
MAAGRLAVGRQHKLARSSSVTRCTVGLEDADTTERTIRAFAGRQARKDDVLDRWLERRRETHNVPVAVGQERDGKPIPHTAVRPLRQFEGLIVAVPLSQTTVPRPVSVPSCSLIDITRKRG